MTRPDKSYFYATLILKCVSDVSSKTHDEFRRKVAQVPFHITSSIRHSYPKGLAQAFCLLFGDKRYRNKQRHK